MHNQNLIIDMISARILCGLLPIRFSITTAAVSYTKFSIESSMMMMMMKKKKEE